MHLQITQIDTTFNGIIIWFNEDHTFIPYTELTKFQLQYFTAIEKCEKENNEEE